MTEDSCCLTSDTPSSPAMTQESVRWQCWMKSCRIICQMNQIRNYWTVRNYVHEKEYTRRKKKIPMMFLFFSKRIPVSFLSSCDALVVSQLICHVTLDVISFPFLLFCQDICLFLSQVDPVTHSCFFFALLFASWSSFQASILRQSLNCKEHSLLTSCLTWRWSVLIEGDQTPHRDWRDSRKNDAIKQRSKLFNGRIPVTNLHCLKKNWMICLTRKRLSRNQCQRVLLSQHKLTSFLLFQTILSMIILALMVVSLKWHPWRESQSFWRCFQRLR